MPDIMKGSPHPTKSMDFPKPTPKGIKLPVIILMFCGIASFNNVYLSTNEGEYHARLH